MKTILLTGSTGMVGRNILEHDSFKKFDFLTPSRRELDLLSKDSVARYIRQKKPELIIHAAGTVGGIQANVSNPVKFLTENIYQGMNLVSESYRAGVVKFLNLGSSCMYPRYAVNPLRERDILKGELEPTNEGYALSKIATARLCEYVSREDRKNLYRTIIPCNLYGRHDNFDPVNAHMIPAVIRKIYKAKRENRKAVDIWGDGSARREFMYAGDLADFLFYAIDRFELLPPYINVGLGYDYSVTDYYKIISESLGYEGDFVFDEAKPVGMMQKLVNIDCLNDFGWKARTSLNEGLRHTIKYFIEEKI
ncbi:GDP-L-fucose synthase [Alteromonadaceae bacterium 2753L.S.0a.02]|nr:GDP-L-fucose synthase [Alteromonadaceae bacterium 2753L.S.0a.02]